MNINNHMYTDVHYDGVIFDFDGTLVDSSRVWADVLEQFLTRRRLSLDFDRDLSTMTLLQSAQVVRDHYALNDDIRDIIAEWHDLAYDNYATHLKLLPGCYDYLSRAYEAGKRITLATLCYKQHATDALRNNGVLHMFDAVITDEDVERGNKRYPDIYLYASLIMGLPPAQCHVFEDLPLALNGVMAAGMTATLIGQGQPEDYNPAPLRVIPNFTALHDVF